MGISENDPAYVDHGVVLDNAATDGASNSATRPNPTKMMIVGDSMTAGSQGDYTWRYRLWSWLNDNKIPVKFVGPYLGTQEADIPKPPQPPNVPGDPSPPDLGPRTSGPYAPDCDPSFDSHHFSTWGYAAAQAKGVIQDRVATHAPDMLLVMLGFNDMGWFISDAKGTLESTKEIVEKARVANPKIKLALSSVCERTHMDGRQDLVDNTLNFNKWLKEQIPIWSTAESPIALVQIAEHYTCETAAYDGLHPNALGDWQIAQAFSKTLHHSFGISAPPIEIPHHIPERKLPVPNNIVAEGAPMGVKVTWEPVLGAMFYDIRHRIAPSTNWGDGRTNDNRYDTTYPSPGEHWEYQVRSGYGTSHGEWSKTVSAISRRETAPPPRKIKTRALPDGFHISWEPLEGSWDVERYEIMWFDCDEHGFPGIEGARGHEATIKDLKPGHRYLTWMATWTKLGGGVRKGARPIRVGDITSSSEKSGNQILPTPTELMARRDGPHGVKLEWKAVECAAAYRIFKKKLSEAGSEFHPDGDVRTETDGGFGFLFPSAADYSFAVQAVNGEVESELCEGVSPERALE